MGKRRYAIYASFVVALTIASAVAPNCGPEPELLPRVAYSLVLTNHGPETWGCATQTIYPDLTTDETLANSFSAGCVITLVRKPGETELYNICDSSGVNLACKLSNLVGNCTDSRADEVCYYSAQLKPLND